MKQGYQIFLISLLQRMLHASLLLHLLHGRSHAACFCFCFCVCFCFTSVNQAIVQIESKLDVNWCHFRALSTPFPCSERYGILFLAFQSSYDLCSQRMHNFLALQLKMFATTARGEKPVNCLVIFSPWLLLRVVHKEY